ncbi:hypothetical protein ABB37_04787 [Leptomonas pyrrhocoris]|uniref:Uncharacterized protein n=1 Tax=Leptomonas pyrrhocoris TaxID=157538 RepID=A0A0M9G224_LEPPY|nr:hypothetical protein ABB37_04787 [Leptomonas pyrrhocoris]KPA80589.1 hypothetical protein ABB37_04787 [Leptomonas pyrrhocoris]|eukprot:XP_015659028.1 hypothetical protein ABB37_04787 [Leptomonas pyrrhocoris]
MDASAQSAGQHASSLNHNGYAVERNRQKNAGRLLCRSNELLHTRRAFVVWVAATRARKLQGHMNRCAILMKHGTLRQDYSRFFLRWLAYTQARTSSSYRGAIQIGKDVPLRSKADFLALARRYFTKWRTHLRQTKQRTTANVDLLIALNRERLRTRTLLRWWKLSHTNTAKRHSLEVHEHEDTIRRLQEESQKVVQEAAALRDQLAEALQVQARLQGELDARQGEFDGSRQRQQAELDELRESMRAAIEKMKGSSDPNVQLLRQWGTASPTRKSDPLTNGVDGSAAPDVPPPPSLESTVAGFSVNGAPHSKETQLALARSIEGATAALAELADSSAAPTSMVAAIAAVRRRLEVNAEDFARVKEQRDDLVAAAKATRLVFASTLPSLDATGNSLADSDLDVSRDASFSPSRLADNDLSSVSATRSSHRADRSNSPRSGAAAAIISNSVPPVRLPSVTSTPSPSAPSSPREMTRSECLDLRRLLLEDAKNIAATVETLGRSESQAKNEVAELQDAALRAIDALGGTGVMNSNFIAPPEETVDGRAQRSNAIAMTLRNLCEDMVVVLVLTSLWSGQQASERVSEALERLWHRNQDLEDAYAGDLTKLDGVMKVVHVAARLLRQPTPASSTAAPRNATHRPASPTSARKRRTVSFPHEKDDEGPLKADELDDARRCAEELAAKGDGKPAALLKLCEDLLNKMATQSTLLTSELEGLLRSSRDLLAATVGVEKDGAATPPGDLAAKGEEAPNGSVVPAARPHVPEMVAALQDAAQRVARVLHNVGDGASKPLVLATQDLLEQLEEAKTAQAAIAEQLQAAVAQVSATEDQRSQEADRHNDTEQNLQQQLEALKEEFLHAQDEKKQLEDSLHEEKTAHEEVLKALEEQRETAKVARQLHDEAMEKTKEAQQAADEEKRKLSANAEALQKNLQSAAAQQASSNERQQELQKQLEDLTKQLAESGAAKHELEDQLAAANAAIEAHAAVRADLEQHLLFMDGENRVNNAVGVFLRDVLRDCLTRLHFLTRSFSDEEQLSPRASLKLQQAIDAPPPLLTHDSDPSEYVEYILRLDGNDPTGKRLVQEHLRENCAVHGLREPVEAVAVVRETGADAAASMTAEAALAATSPPAGTAADPSTWEVVAELHDRLVLLYERMAHVDQVAATQLVINGTLLQEKDHFCADALIALKRLQSWSPTAASVAAAAAAAAATHPTGGHSRSPSTVSPKNAEEQNTLSASTIEPAVAGPAVRASSSEVAQALEALQKVADSVRPLVQLRSATSVARQTSASAGPSDAAVAAATAQVQALVADVQDMANCLQDLSESVQHGILALEGVAVDDGVKEGDGLHGNRAARAASGGDGPHRVDHAPLPAGQSSAGGDGGDAGALPGPGGVKLDSHMLAARLETVCKDTGTSILELKHLLFGDADTDAPAKPLKLGDAIPQIRAKMAELAEVKKESARLLIGLNRAFDDDEESLFAGSVSSTMSRTLKPKKKPLPAFQGTPEAGLRLLQQEIKGKKGHRTVGPSERSMGSHIRDRLGDLQNLRLACRSTLQVLEGRAASEEDGQSTTYGEALVTLLTTQVEDLKQALVESGEALKGYRNDLRNVTVGTRLRLLADVVNSLKLERDSLKEDINRRGRQSNMLLDGLNKEVKTLKADLASHREANSQLAAVNDGISEELDSQKRDAAELATQLAQLQQESNVLSTALARSLQGLPATPYGGEAPSAVEESIQAALKSDQGDALTKSVEEALSAAEQNQQHLRDTFHSSLDKLRTDLGELRAFISQSWALYGAPMAETAAQLVTETSAVLTLENDMLRPRAVEREKLKRDVAMLEAALAESKATRDAAMAQVRQSDEENTQLRRALCDAEMAQVLNSASNINDAAQASRAVDRCTAEWERRMIASATDLAMDAIDSMSGQSMSAVIGAVTEETLRLYKGVRVCLREVALACEAARGTDGRRLWAEMEGRLQDLAALSASADYLWTRLPVLSLVSYQ